MKKMPKTPGQTRQLPAWAGSALSSVPFLLIFLALEVFSGCTLADSASKMLSSPLPYKFVRGRSLAGQIRFFFDLDHDGREESVEIRQEPHPGGIYRAMFYGGDLELVDQINFNGPVKKVTAFDWDSDGFKDLFFFYLKNDTTLYLRILDRKLRRLAEAPVLSGKPRKEEGVVYPWLGQIISAFYTDLEKDGRQELVLIANEGYARKPRGAFVYDGATLKLKWHYDIGPAVTQFPAVEDVDGDGFKEIMLPTASPCNGNRANGTDDFHSYVFLIDHKGELRWRKLMGGKYSTTRAFCCDLDGNRRKEIVVFRKHTLTSRLRPGIAVLNPTTGSPLVPERKLQSPMATNLVAQVDSDLPLEILVSNRDGELLLLDDKLAVQKRRKFPEIVTRISVVPDVNEDGENEIFCATQNWIFWLNTNLSPLAKLHNENPKLNNRALRIYHDANGNINLIFFDRDAHPVLYRLQEVPAYFFRTYGPPVLLLILFLIVAYSSRKYVELRTKNRYLEKALEKSLTLQNVPALILDARNRITMANVQAKLALHLPNNHIPITLEEVSKKNPELARLLANLRSSDPVRQQFTFVDRRRGGIITELQAEPIDYPGQGHPNWFVQFHSKSPHPDLSHAQDWAALASRVAHEIKNPLTSIQLTLQRMQRALKSAAFSSKPNLDAFFDRLFERIEHLRKVSRNFMKFMNLEELSFAPTDLNHFVQELLESHVIEIPSDIQLELKLQPGLPPIRADRDQLQSLLENLIANAIHAMPDGGVLTIRTENAGKFRLETGENDSAGFVLLEIQDTGVGIPEEIRPHLFKPFVKGNRKGTGLGLTIVSKIVRDHGGHIEIHSEVHAGTSVSVYLPIFDRTKETRKQQTEKK